MTDRTEKTPAQKPPTRRPDQKPPVQEKRPPSGTAQPINDPPGTGYKKPRPGYPTP